MERRMSWKLSCTVWSGGKLRALFYGQKATYHYNHVIQGCELGTTRIQTKELGIVQLQDVSGFNLSVWNGTKWTRGDILPAGKKQKCIVTFRGGQQFICSPEHLFQVVSHKGNKRWVACKDLLGKKVTKNAHRVVINREYEPSNNMYNSNWAYKYASKAHNANNVFLEHIGNTYDIGLVLGRLASDGSLYLKENGGRVTQIVAEHEYNILPELRKCMESLNFREVSGELREGRTEKITRLEVGSKSLANEINDLDIKHQIHKNIFMDTELLRGFLCGMFDGDGGVCGSEKSKNKFINLVFGKQYNFEPMCRDIQKALLFFGIRSYYKEHKDRYVISIRRLDIPRFLDMVGFMNEDKMKKGRSITCNKDEHVFGPSLMVESVEITDEYVDMYDVCNTEDGYYVADGLITHNTAADIYKQSVNNMFNRICKEGWLGKVLINGFIHDEMLMEVHKSINPYYFFKAWREEFEVKPAHYCRLYAGAGVGKCWYDAKKLDLHPLYIDEIINTYEEDMPWNENISEFLSNVKIGFKKHKTNRIKEYITDKENQGEIIKPAIGAMLGDEMDIILDDVSNDAEKVEKFNAVLKDTKLEYKGKNKIKGLQDQLRTFCLYYGVDYDSIDIKSLDDVKIEVKGIQAGDNIDDEDEIEIEVDKNAFLMVGLMSNGIIIDQETRTIHMAELWIHTDKGYIQGTKQFIDKYMIVQGDKGYKIMYYPNLKDEQPQGKMIQGYCVPFENGSVLIHYYKEMLSRRFAIIVK